MSVYKNVTIWIVLPHSIRLVKTVIMPPPATEGVGVISDDAIRPSVCLSYAPIIGGKRCVLGICLLSNKPYVGSRTQRSVWPYDYRKWPKRP